MKKFIYLAAASGLILALSASCKSNQVNVNTAGVVQTETINQTEGVIHKVLYGHWTVAQVSGLTVDGSDRPYVEFGEDTTNPFLVKVYAFNGCNYINGEYAVTPGGSIKPTANFAATMKMCDDAPYEMGVTMALNTVTNYKIEKVGTDYLLYFVNASGATTMTLRKNEADYINGAWQVTAIDGQSVGSNADLQLVLDLSAGTIHGNVGCNTMNGKVVTDPDRQNSIAFTSMVTTRMTCPDIATEQSLLQALRTVATSSLSDDANTLTLKNVAGQNVVTLRRLNIK